jgi:hypothetical protein
MEDMTKPTAHNQETITERGFLSVDVLTTVEPTALIVRRIKKTPQRVPMMVDARLADDVLDWVGTSEVASLENDFKLSLLGLFVMTRTVFDLRRLKHSL